MPAFAQIPRAELIRALRAADFSILEPGGLVSGHCMVRRGTLTLAIPKYHCTQIKPGLLAEILRQGGISREEWEKL